MLTVMVLLLFLLTTVFDWVTVLKHAEKKVKIIHSCIMLIGFCVLMLYSFEIPVPSPSDIIKNTVEAIFKLKS
ncbi:MAG: hypothetical protein ACOX88_02105 [Christensenellales bacterium]|jgi:hypothetical protein